MRACTVVGMCSSTMRNPRRRGLIRRRTRPPCAAASKLPDDRTVEPPGGSVLDPPEDALAASPTPSALEPRPTDFPGRHLGVHDERLELRILVPGLVLEP